MPDEFRQCLDAPLRRGTLRSEGWLADSAPTLMTDVPTTARIAADALALVKVLP